MQIKFVRSGGFAGAATAVAGTVQFDEQGAHVDGDATDYHRDLPPQETNQLRAAVEPGAVTAAEAAPAGPGPVRDGYQYDITLVTKDGKSHSFTLGEEGTGALRTWIGAEAQKIWNHRMAARK